ncbi:P-loop containing nucleoside triphosphate hydrolase protein [Leptodontidium sp. 2 PMI_412]|nr:P-loop containing nucleoside triphosphate hydrolase protein [Leptodontidium sp. 2 PMI_412]
MGDNIAPEDEMNEAGIGLGDQDTLNRLQFIERLHAIGVARYTDLPQLVVVGDQNSGKSSVLQAITQLPFPVNDTVCTRFATEVSLRRSPGLESLELLIKRTAAQESERFDVSEYNSAFGSPEFKTQFGNMLARASDNIFGPRVNSTDLTETTLHITVNTPTQINLTIVDLPGLVSASHSSSQMARTLVSRHIENPRSTILNIPDRENRVIGFINKCDRKQEGADHWGELNQPTKLGISNLRSALTRMHNAQIARAIPLLSPEIKERLESCKTRRAQLRQPRTTQREQRGCMIELASSFTKLSTDALDGHYHNIQDYPLARIRKSVRDSLDGFQGRVQRTFDNIVPELPNNILTSLDENSWRNLMLADRSLRDIHCVRQENRGREFPDEVNQNVLRVLWAAEIVPWFGVATSCIDNMVGHLQSSINVLMQQATLDDELRTKSTQWLSEVLQDTTKLTHEELSQLAGDDSHIWTLSPRYMTLSRAMYNKYITNIARDLVSLTPDRAATISERERENQVKLWLSNNKDVDAVSETHVRLRVYYDIASK